MPNPLSPTDICNVALSKIGAQPIQSLTDTTNQSSITCNTNFVLCYLEVSRATRWNCLLTTAILVQTPQTPLPGFTAPVTSTDWAPNTSYAADVYLNYGGYVYLTAYAYTSSNNFVNDLTTGALIQTNHPTSGSGFWPGVGSQYPSGWAYAYKLPSDFQLLGALNDNLVSWGWDGLDSSSDSEYEIMGDTLFCNTSQAVAKYVKNQPDTTQWDSLFTNAMTLKLASAIATTLRQDSGKLEMVMLQAYNAALVEARGKNAGEKLPRRFNPIGSSMWTAARYSGLNG